MAVTEKYVVEVNKKCKYSTSETSSGYIHITKSDFASMLSHFYYAGYIKCMNDVNDKYKESLNNSTQQGGYNMDVDKILECIGKLDEKIDKKIDKIDNKLDNINNNFSNLNREIGEIKMSVDNLEKRNSFWRIYILAPVITSIVTTILISFFKK